MNGKAIFLDRDGVLIDNSEHYYIWRNEQLKLVDGIFDNLKLLLLKGYQLFIVSNQGGISKGLYSKVEIIKLHNQLLQIFRNNNIEITEIVFCPHHQEFEKCMCRKPDSIMIEKLLAKYKLSREGSFLIGDSRSDMDAALKAGIQSIQIPSNCNMQPFISKLIR
jgi:D-glycero-D-manno-heptose 1,7-bisphosphate phosphatase